MRRDDSPGVGIAAAHLDPHHKLPLIQISNSNSVFDFSKLKVYQFCVSTPKRYYPKFHAPKTGSKRLKNGVADQNSTKIQFNFERETRTGPIEFAAANFKSERPI